MISICRDKQQKYVIRCTLTLRAMQNNVRLRLHGHRLFFYREDHEIGVKNSAHSLSILSQYIYKLNTDQFRLTDTATTVRWTN